jgi:triacylglycerol esterase/lipase EstA (alpha/beta hydrolase family)
VLHRVVCLAGCLALVAAPASAKAPPLKTPAGKLARAFACHGRLAGAKRDPVLLVHGTFADSAINWSWNYAKTLPASGRPACTVDLPDRSSGDIQVSAEYVVFALRAMARESGRKVAVLGHSQGGLDARWALRWWPDLRNKVSDVVMTGAPNHGAVYSDATCTAPSACAASLWQMRSDSRFLGALDAGGDTVGDVAYTSIASDTDTTFVLPQQARIRGGRAHVTNVAVQDLCPGRGVDHNGLVYDAVSNAIVLDALAHPGPARPSRIDPAVCGQDTMPGTTRAQADEQVASYTSTLVELLGPNGPKTPGEPPLAAYARRRR